MATNIESKWRCSNLAAAAKVCESAGAAFRRTLHQTDTYFNAREGRLKLRQHSGSAELIAYVRPDVPAHRESRYTIARIDDITAVRSALEESLGIIAVVRKRRNLWIRDNVRIHLDEVDGLGEFVEFEGVVNRQADETVSLARVESLCTEFHDVLVEPVSLSYVDLAVKHSPSLRS